MIPYKAGGPKSPCSPVSSSCTSWEGPDLCCIEVCPDDTLTDIIFKISQKLCNHDALLDLSSLNMKGIVVSNKNLITVLQAIVDKIKDLED